MSILGEALGIDPQAFNRGAENQIKLQQLQRIEQERLDRMKLKSPMIDRTVNVGSAPVFDSSGYGSPQIGVVPPREEVKVETLPSKIELDSTSSVDGNVTGNQTIAVPDKVELKVPDYDPTAELDMSKIGVSKTPDITQIDQESSQFLQSLDSLFAKSDFAKILNKIQSRIAIGYGDMLAGSPAGRAWGWFTDSPSEAAKRADSKAALDWFQSEDALKYFSQNPKELTGAAADPIGFHKTFIADAPNRAKLKVYKESKDVTDGIITARTNDFNVGLSTPQSMFVGSVADAVGFDKYFALSVLAMESDYGRTTKTQEVELKDGTKVTISGSMQVSKGTFDQMKAWYSNPANIKEYNITLEAQKFASALDFNNPEHQMVAGILYLKYGEYIGIPRNLLAAGYQGGMETVRDLKRPVNADDGTVTNTDYNRAVVNIYNNMLLAFPPDANKTTTTAGLKTDTSAGTSTVADSNVTEAQSSNTSNTAKASENVSSLQTIDTVDQIVKDTDKALGGIISDTTANSDGSSAGSNVFSTAMYLADPSKAGQDTKYVLETREQAVRIVNRLNQKAAEYARFAEVARLNGNFESYEKYLNLADETEANALTARASVSQVDQKLLYLQGMQGLNDLKFGNTNKAAMVWSMYSGRDVRIIPRTDEKFNITIDGEYYKTGVSEAELSQELQLTFDSNFRANMQKMAGEKSMKLFEAGIDIQKELQKQQAIMIKEIKVQEVKDKAAILLESIKQANGEFKAIGDGSGRGTVVLNGTLYLFDPNVLTKGPDGIEVIKPQLKPLTPPAVTSNATGNAYVSALNNNKGG